MKVLFLGGGRRNSLARRFKAKGCEVLAYELSESVPIAKECKVIVGKPWQTAERHVSEVCSEYGINLTIPLDDRATLIAASISMAGVVKSPTSTVETNNICLDKRAFESSIVLGTNIPYPTLSDDFKIIRKPRFGFNSKNISVVENITEKDEDFVYQSFIENGIEYSVDCYFDVDSHLVGAVPRTRLLVQGGEVAKSQTVSRESLDYQLLRSYVHELGSVLNMRGPACVQFIKHPITGIFYIMEANARFGGGVILSLEAGFDIIQMILDEYINDKAVSCYEKWTENLVMHRYFDEYFYEEKICV